MVNIKRIGGVRMKKNTHCENCGEETIETIDGKHRVCFCRGEKFVFEQINNGKK